MIYSVQYMRAIASIMVLITHSAYKINQINPGSEISFGIGGFGVDLFFMISGFVIFMSISGKDISPQRFMFLRLLRVIPLYWFATTLALVVFLLVPSVVNSSGGAVNVLYSYLLIPSESKFLIQNGWTLSYELYFYFIVALIILFTKNDVYKGVAIFLILNLLSVMGWRGWEEYIFNFLTNIYLVEFSLGVLVYMLWARGYVFSPIVGFFISVLGGILLFLYEMEVYIINSKLLSMLSMFMVFSGFIFMEPVFNGSKSSFSKLLVDLGNSSYSLYLFHPFFLSTIFLIFRYLGLDISSEMQLLIYLSVSIFLSHMVYLFIEIRISKCLKFLKG